ncbi:MAG: stage 0 sporulation family protein [Phycisphaerales bacterium]
MSIFPLPVFEADADPDERSAMTDAEIYARLEPPKTMVVRFGAMKLVGEYPYSGDAKPGCGSKLIVRTHRGTEVAEMLTTTCTNAGCGKSVTRKELLSYIDNSGGRDFPFHTRGRIVRVATVEDLNAQSTLADRKPALLTEVRSMAREFGLEMKIIDVELILGGEQMTYFYTAEERVDFRELLGALKLRHQSKIELTQVGARDEARLVADYERCGQYCCCKNFLKVLKPVSMGAAKMQKATLDPLKISGRCGRLMCCLRYEDATYRELKSKLPARKSRVGTTEGPGIVMATKILVQLALVKLEHDNREIAVPIEELLDPETCPKPGDAKAKAEAEAQIDPMRGLGAADARLTAGRTDSPPERRSKRSRGGRGSRNAAAEGGDVAADAAATSPRKKKSRRSRGGASGTKDAKRDAPKSAGGAEARGPQDNAGTVEGRGPAEAGDPTGTPAKKRRRRGGRGRGTSAGSGSGSGSGTGTGTGDGGPTEGRAPKPSGEGDARPAKKRRRRGRRGGRGGGGAAGDGGGGSGGGGDAG